MDLAKPCIDVGVMTDALDPMLAFWQQRVGLALEGVLPTGRGNRQHRHGLPAGSVFKLNCGRDPQPPGAASGYRELRIAREGTARHVALRDPDGNRVCLVPPGAHGVSQIGLHLEVRDEDAFHRFYREGLGLEPVGERSYRCGQSLLSFEAGPNAGADPALGGRGYRYFTIQVRDVDREHRRVLAGGGTEGTAPMTLGEVARISFVRDPDGNWIELSQRASLVGSLSRESTA